MPPCWRRAAPSTRASGLACRRGTASGSSCASPRRSTRHRTEIDELQTLDNGVPVGFTAIYQLSSAIAADAFTYHAGWVDKIAGSTLPTYTGNEFFTYTLKEPVGVVAAVIPWNAPVMLFAQKMAPALAAGCTVVLKPSEFASLDLDPHGRAVRGGRPARPASSTW